MLNEEISGLVGGLRSSSNSSVAAFARMEQKVEQLEAEAESAGQLGVRKYPLFMMSLLISNLNSKTGLLRLSFSGHWHQMHV